MGTGMSFTITLEWLVLHSNNGALTRDQVVTLGESWPIEQGWKRRWAGMVISEEQQARFERRLPRKIAKQIPAGAGELF